jgi:hypothetical protein
MVPVAEKLKHLGDAARQEIKRRKAFLGILIVLVILSGVILFVFENWNSGGQNAITASQPIQRPTTAHCKIVLLQTIFQSGSTIFNGTYSPPATCSPPWSMIVLDWNGTAMGPGTDRIGAIWISSVEIFRTSTPETEGASWHVEKDVSEYSSLFKSTQTITSTVTAYSNQIGIVATLSFYETSPQYPGESTPDMVIPVASTLSPPWFTISDSNTQVSARIYLPRNIVNATLEVYATAHHCDETWFDSYIFPQSGCSGSDAFREIQVFLDGNLSGFVWPVPVIYTGGINPNLWETIPAVNALNIPPTIVPLTPFAGLLSNSIAHTISFSVLGNMGYWLIDANLLLKLDPSSQTVTGQLTKYNIPDANVQGSVNVNWLLGSATIGQDCNRGLTLSGYVNSSVGNVETTVSQRVSMSDTQVTTRNRLGESFSVAGAISTTVTTSQIGSIGNQTIVESYSVSMSQPFLSTRGILTIEVDQNVQLQHILLINGVGSTDQSTDLVVAHSNGETSENYSYSNNLGGCFSHYVSTEHGSVSSNTASTSCG